MITVAVYELDMDKGRERLVGTLSSDGKSIILSDPSNFILQRIVEEPARDGPAGWLDPSDPDDFLRRLHRVYKSAYLCVTKPLASGETDAAGNPVDDGL